ncbi:MAG: MarR family transcriptional regulator [Bacteroidetes bacterium]|jgi:MarR family transcriptional regulator for hemolysin|nr:MarR family transcriptional regulator [Bacteroidota bacterium]
MEKLDSVLFYYIEKAIKSYRQFAQRELKNAGLSITVDQWLTLNYLNENPQITQKELAEAIFKDTASITRIIDLLVTAKYIKRNINKEDKRKSNLSITNLGLEIIDKASPIVNNYRNQALKGIGIAKEDHVKMVMKTIIKNCQ